MTVSILVNAIRVPSVDQVVSNTCEPAPNDVSFVVVLETVSRTYTSQHDKDVQVVVFSRAKASLVPSGLQAGARSLAAVWIVAVTVPVPGSSV